MQKASETCRVLLQLLIDLLNSSDYMVSNVRMRGESRFRNNIEIEVHDIDLHHYCHHRRFNSCI